LHPSLVPGRIPIMRREAQARYPPARTYSATSHQAWEQPPILLLPWDWETRQWLVVPPRIRVEQWGPLGLTQAALLRINPELRDQEPLRRVQVLLRIKVECCARGARIQVAALLQVNLEQQDRQQIPAANLQTSTEHRDLGARIQAAVQLLINLEHKVPQAQILEPALLRMHWRPALRVAQRVSDLHQLLLTV
jgi:hypothetical protein